MEKCCRDTFLETIKHVLYVIEINDCQNVDEIKNGLQYAVKLLERESKE